MAASTPGPDDKLLAEFLKHLDAEADRDAVVRRYCDSFPSLAAEFRQFANVNQALDHSRPDLEPEQPKQLGEFRIFRRMARGGMGEIYEANHERLGRRVAVKVIRHGRISPLSRARFLREQHTLAQLHQTHIVPIHTAGEEGPLQYFVMPYIDGAALHHVVRTARQLETSKPGSHTPPLKELASMVASNPASGRRQPSNSECHQGADAPRSPVTQDVPPPADRPAIRFSLSLDYFRSVAEVMADAADALHHAHAAGILHRDVKPSNLMVDTHGQSWIIDFGLAKLVGSGQRAMGSGPCPEGGEDEASSLSTAHCGLPTNSLTATGILGTPQYMAPEQWDGKADVASDVWGLGATLYELLTLRRPFDAATDAALREQIQSHTPAAPRNLVANVPRDLAAISLKALHKEPGKRYATAKEFADDLRRWSRLEPTVARPALPLRRLWLWSRRNKGWAAAIAAVTLTILIGLSAVAYQQRMAKEAHRREVLLLRMQAIRLGTHKTTDDGGWSDEAWSLVREAAKIRRDDNLRDQAAATLVGLDGQLAKQIDFSLESSASSVALDGKGKRVLVGGSDHDPARLWNGGVEEPIRSRQIGSGPVAFRDDGTPLQLVLSAKNPASLLLWDVAKQQLVHDFALPIKEKASVSTLTLSPDGLLAAAAFKDGDGKGSILVLDTRTGKPLEPITRSATALAIAPGGGLLATGDENGMIGIWSLPKGELIADLPADENRVHSLAFGRDYLRGDRRKQKYEASRDWLLASGQGGGQIIIWELVTGTPRNFCRGNSYDVYALAFSSDGSTLASAGRGPTVLWDVATGRKVIEFGSTGWQTGVALSADMRRLAASMRPSFGSPGGTFVWDLSRDRGLQILRGLAAPVRRVGFSPDGRYLAVLSDDWRLGVWEAASGRLLHVIAMPAGETADNGGWAFSSDNRLAFCSGSKATLWDLVRGVQIRDWTLPEGLVDHLAFHASGKLLLFRVEAENELPLERWNEPVRQQRVCRIRDLLGKDPLKPTATITDFSHHVVGAAITPDGNWVAVDGRQGRTIGR